MEICGVCRTRASKKGNIANSGWHFLSTDETGLVRVPFSGRDACGGEQGEDFEPREECEQFCAMREIIA